jgi:hypothetical protein
MVKRIFRWIFIFSGILAVLVSIASGVAWHYKPELTAAIHEKIRDNINGEFSIDNVSVSVIKDFPRVSVTLEGIYLRGLKYNIYKRDFLTAKKVVVNVNLFKLLRKEVDVTSIRLSEIEVFIFTTKSGYSNLDIFRKGKKAAIDSSKAETPELLNIHTIYFDNVAIALQDSSKGKAFGFRFVNGKNEFVQTDSSRQFRYSGKIDFEKLQFNEKKGSYLLNQSVEADLNGEFIARQHQLNLESSRLKFPGSTLELSGDFHFIPDGKFSLNIHSENLNYAEGKALLPKALGEKLSRYDIGSPFKLGVKIRGKLTPGNDPSVDLHFETTDALLTIAKNKASHVYSKGSFTNHADSTKSFSDMNSKIEITSFKGEILGLQVQLAASFHNLLDPFVDLEATIHADAKSLQREMDSSNFHFRTGELTTQVSFAGKLNALTDPGRYGSTGKLKGRSEMKNMKVLWVPRNISINNLNSTISFDQNQCLIESFTFLLNKSQVAIKGNISGFTPWLTTSTQKGFVKLQVSSRDLNLTGLLPENHTKSSTADKEKQLKRISQIFDNVYKRLEFDLSLSIDKLQQRNFKAAAVTGNILLKNNELQGNSIRLALAGGNADINFGLSQLNKPVNPLWVQANVHQADIKDFFNLFNNFNQHTIDAQNLSGTIDATIGFNGLLDDDFNLLMPTLIGNVDLSVKNGKLSHFSPLEKMSNFLFKDRDFSDVDFAEIKSTFDLKGTELSISRMEVESSVISLFIEGRYSLSDSTDLTIQLPLSNLKRRNKDYKPKNVGIDSKVGPSVFLRARGDGKGNIAIAYDPFHKFRKK